jgi:hypothetical protein
VESVDDNGICDKQVSILSLATGIKYEQRKGGTSHLNSTSSTFVGCRLEKQKYAAGKLRPVFVKR